MHGVDMNQCPVDDFKAAVVVIESKEKICPGQKHGFGALVFAKTFAYCKQSTSLSIRDDACGCHLQVVFVDSVEIIALRNQDFST